MSILKTGFVAASLCLAASFAYADSSVPVQGAPVLKQDSQMSSDARAAFASARTMKTWTKATPFSREALEDKSGH